MLTRGFGLTQMDFTAKSISPFLGRAAWVAGIGVEASCACAGVFCSGWGKDGRQHKERLPRNARRVE